MLLHLEQLVCYREYLRNTHIKTGIDIHPSATIDVPFMIDHGTELLLVKPQLLGSMWVFIKVLLWELCK
jgi:serine acetyltransferase